MVATETTIQRPPCAPGRDMFADGGNRTARSLSILIMTKKARHPQMRRGLVRSSERPSTARHIEARDASAPASGGGLRSFALGSVRFVLPAGTARGQREATLARTKPVCCVALLWRAYSHRQTAAREDTKVTCVNAFASISWAGANAE